MKKDTQCSRSTFYLVGILFGVGIMACIWFLVSMFEIKPGKCYKYTGEYSSSDGDQYGDYYSKVGHVTEGSVFYTVVGEGQVEDKSKSFRDFKENYSLMHSCKLYYETGEKSTTQMKVKTLEKDVDSLKWRVRDLEDKKK